MFSFLCAFTSGGVSLADVERLKDDEPLKAFLGVARIPDQSAHGEPGRLALRPITQDFVAGKLQRVQPERYLQSPRLEAFFDDTPIEVNSAWFQGPAIHDEGNGSLSWPIRCWPPRV